MRAKIVHAHLDPRRIDEAVEAVHAELIPQFLALPGAVQGYWTARPATGHVLVMTVWSDEDAVRRSSAVDGAQRARVAERLGMQVHVVHTMDVLGAHERGATDGTTVRWARVTRADRVLTDVQAAVPALFREVVPDQARSRGFCGSYWLADRATGAGLALSFWDGPADLADSEVTSRRRRQQLEEALGCRIGSVEEYEALGVAAPVAPTAARVPVTWTRPVDVPALAPADRTEALRLARLGTTVDRAPGAVLSVAGTRTDEVVVILDGDAVSVNGAGVARLGRGDHFGGRGILQRRRHAATSFAGSPIRLHVYSRPEFRALVRDVPAVAERLVAGDREG